MRIDVKKFLFWGPKSERKNFFSKAQELGVVHFITPSSPHDKPLPTELEKVSAAIKILRILQLGPQEEPQEHSQSDTIVESILKKNLELEKIREGERILNLEINRLEPLGDYSSEDIKWIEQHTGRNVQFFCAPEGVLDFDAPDNELIFITNYNGLDYLIALDDKGKQNDKLIELKPEAPLGELQERYQQLTAERRRLENEIKQYAKYCDFLRRSLTFKLNDYNLLMAESSVEHSLEEKLFVTSGWVPESKIDDLKRVASTLRIQIEEIAVEEGDIIPTYLENHGLGRIGEDLVNIYDTPSVDDQDPSLWVLFSFAIFFAMIIGDGGYGLLLFAAGLAIQFYYKKFTKSGRRVLNLFFILCSFTIAWGVLTSSFFGITIAPDSPMRKFSLVTWLAEKKTAYHFSRDDQVAKEWKAKFPSLEAIEEPRALLLEAQSILPDKSTPSYEMLNAFSDNILLELSLLAGVIHITLSLLRYLSRNIVNLGWIAFLIGSYLYIPHYLSSDSLIHFALGLDSRAAASNGLLLMAGGVGFASIASLIKNKMLGILEPVMAIQIFADVLSYMRLYALGLASALITATAMDLAAGLNVVLAALILIPSHLLNITLGIMSGVIHGLRLNFLEWYHYSFEGGGKLFIPLKKMKVERPI